MMRRLEALRYQEEAEVLPIGEMTFEAFIAEVLALDEAHFYQQAVMNDPVFGKMTPAFQSELIREGIACGEWYAQTYLAKEKNITQLFKQTKIDFRVEEMPAGGGHVIFAQFKEPNQITLFTDSLDQYDELIATTLFQTELAKEIVQDVLMAHEFFHYLEASNHKQIITLTKKLTLWQLLGFKYETTLISLSEIAAMSFAKAYTGFPYSPFIFDSLLTYAYNQEMSYKIYQQAAKIKMG